MNNYFVTLASATMLLLSVSCKKEVVQTPVQHAEKEAVATEPVTPEAAAIRQINEPDSRHVYYFSISTKASERGLLTGWEYPRLDMQLALIPVSFPIPILMGLGNPWDLLAPQI